MCAKDRVRSRYGKTMVTDENGYIEVVFREKKVNFPMRKERLGSMTWSVRYDKYLASQIIYLNYQFPDLKEAIKRSQKLNRS